MSMDPTPQTASMESAIGRVRVVRGGRTDTNLTYSAAPARRTDARGLTGGSGVRADHTVMDPMSAPYLTAVTVDFVDTLQAFRVHHRQPRGRRDPRQRPLFH